MNKSEFISKLASKSGVTKVVAGKMVDAFYDIIVDSLKKGEEVRHTGYLNISRKKRKSRVIYSPQDGNPIHLPEGYSVSIRIGSKLKESVK